MALAAFAALASHDVAHKYPQAGQRNAGNTSSPGSCCGVWSSVMFHSLEDDRKMPFWAIQRETVFAMPPTYTLRRGTLRVNEPPREAGVGLHHAIRVLGISDRHQWFPLLGSVVASAMPRHG